MKKDGFNFLALKKAINFPVYVFKEIKSGNWTVWSDYQGERVSWAKDLVLTDCSFFVDEKKRESCIKKKRKMPHAGINGTLTNEKIDIKGMKEISYNPYQSSFFFTVIDKKPVKKAKVIVMTSEGKVFAKI